MHTTIGYNAEVHAVQSIRLLQSNAKYNKQMHCNAKTTQYSTRTQHYACNSRATLTQKVTLIADGGPGKFTTKSNKFQTHHIDLSCL